LSANREGGFRTWHVPGLTPEIIYAAGLMQRLAREAEEASRNPQLEGEEVGGVLFGTTEGGQVRVTAARSLTCDHEHGPEFVLNANDERRLQQLVEEAGSDPALQDLTPVGWYRSRTRSEISLGSEDVALYDRYFPLPRQVALILRQRAGEATRAGFFFRPPKGTLRTDGSYLEVGTNAGTPAANVVTPTADAPEVSEFPAPEMFEQPPPEMLDHSVRRMSRGRFLLLAILGGVAAVVAAIGGFLWGRSNATAAQVPAMSLRLVKSNGELRAMWNGSTEAVARASKGSLEVRDGVTSADFPLNPTLLRGGSWPIANQSSEVSVRLTVEVDGAGAITEVARFVGTPAASPPPSPSAAEAAEIAVLQSEIRKLETDLSDQTQANDTTEQRTAILQQQVSAQPAPVKPEPASRQPGAPPTAGNTAPVTASASPQPAQSAAVQTPPPKPSPEPGPPANSSPAPTPPPPSPSFNEGAAAPATRPPPAIPPPPLEPARPSYSGPRSGKTIWTGNLPAGGSISIEGRRASAGSVNGNLPEAPLRVTVFPAEFSSGGLSVYSGQQRHAAGNVVEARSAQNGWLETRYVFNAERARGVTVAEAPSPANGFKLTLRGGERPVSVVVIEWQVAQ
jgi:hypothetical protein